MAKYSKGAGKKVKEVMHEKKEGKLKSGSGKKVTSRKQAIAIALSEAREKGEKVPPPPKKGASKKGASKKGASKKAASKKSASKKSASKKAAPKKAASKKSASKKSSSKSASKSASKK